jgi:hypothetical protein
MKDDELEKWIKKFESKYQTNPFLSNQIRVIYNGILKIDDKEMKQLFISYIEQAYINSLQTKRKFLPVTKTSKALDERINQIQNVLEQRRETFNLKYGTEKRKGVLEPWHQLLRMNNISTSNLNPILLVSEFGMEPKEYITYALAADSCLKDNRLYLLDAEIHRLRVDSKIRRFTLADEITFFSDRSQQVTYAYIEDELQVIPAGNKNSLICQTLPFTAYKNIMQISDFRSREKEILSFIDKELFETQSTSQVNSLEGSITALEYHEKLI